MSARCKSLLGGEPFLGRRTTSLVLFNAHKEDTTRPPSFQVSRPQFKEFFSLGIADFHKQSCGKSTRAHLLNNLCMLEFIRLKTLTAIFQVPTQSTHLDLAVVSISSFKALRAQESGGMCHRQFSPRVCYNWTELRQCSRNRGTF